jgi:predicted DNA-binding transcriptional regulator AlpA
MNENENLIDINAVCTLLGCHKNTVWNMRNRGEMPPPIELRPKFYRWRLGDLRSWINKKSNAGITADTVKCSSF